MRFYCNVVWLNHAINSMEIYVPCFPNTRIALHILYMSPLNAEFKHKFN